MARGGRSATSPCSGDARRPGSEALGPSAGARAAERLRATVKEGMTDTEAKARGIRLERLRSMLEKDRAKPRAALETLMSELRIGDEQPKFWEQRHGAVVRNGKEAELADAYSKMAADRRLNTLSPSAHANLLMHA